jgi:hypothetical protein
MKITVISIGPASDAVRASVDCQFKGQYGVDFNHVYVSDPGDAAPSGGKTYLEHLTDIVSQLPPDRIIALLDPPEQLGPPNALVAIARYYAAGAHATVPFPSFLAKLFHDLKAFPNPSDITRENFMKKILDLAGPEKTGRIRELICITRVRPVVHKPVVSRKA